jgi:methionine-rich copper-binding protein CopC
MRLKKLLYIVTTALVLWPSLASAHPITRKVSPADGEVFPTCPDTFYVRFTQKHKLKQFMLFDAKGPPIDVGFQPRTTTNWEHRVPLPCLSAGQYTISYIVKGRDLHEITNKVSFTVK